jgi:hypothetical protein
MYGLRASPDLEKNFIYTLLYGIGAAPGEKFLSQGLSLI